MSHPSPAAIAWIRARAPDWTRTDQEIAATLNAEMVPNPTEAPGVPAEFDAGTVMAMIGPTSLEKIITLPASELIVGLLNSPARDADLVRRLNQWAGGLARTGRLTQAEFDALAAPAPGTTPGAAVGLFNRVIPQPDWPEFVPRPVAELGRTLDAADVAAARPGV